MARDAAGRELTRRSGAGPSGVRRAPLSPRESEPGGQAWPRGLCWAATWAAWPRARRLRRTGGADRRLPPTSPAARPRPDGHQHPARDPRRRSRLKQCCLLMGGAGFRAGCKGVANPRGGARLSQLVSRITPAPALALARRGRLLWSSAGPRSASQSGGYRTCDTSLPDARPPDP